MAERPSITSIPGVEGCQSRAILSDESPKKVAFAMESICPDYRDPTEQGEATAAKPGKPNCEPDGKFRVVHDPARTTFRRPHASSKELVTSCGTHGRHHEVKDDQEASTNLYLRYSLSVFGHHFVHLSDSDHCTCSDNGHALYSGCCSAA